MNKYDKAREMLHRVSKIDSKIDLVKLKLWCYEGLLSEPTPLDKIEIEALSAYLTYLENVPLTIDELEEMTGDPIYITSLYDDGSIEYGYWTIVPPMLKADETLVFGPDYKYEEKSSYGSDWLAYRFCVKSSVDDSSVSAL